MIVRDLKMVQLITYDREILVMIVRDIQEVHVITY